MPSDARPPPPVALWEQFAAPLRSFIVKRAPGEVDTEDLLQDVFLRIQTSLPKVRQVDRIDAWVFQIAHGVVADAFRKRARREAPIGALVFDQIRGMTQLVAARVVGISISGMKVLKKPSGSAEAVQPLLPRLRDRDFTHVLLVTLPEATPIQEAMQLEPWSVGFVGSESRVARPRVEATATSHDERERRCAVPSAPQIGA